MALPIKIFIDSSGFKAFIDPEDDFHLLADKILKKLYLQKVNFITSNYIIDESATLVRCKSKPAVLKKFKEYVFSSRILNINRVTRLDEANAWVWFQKDWSRLSFTDCVSFAQLQRLGIKRVFGFDHHFEQAGFILEK